MGDRPNLICFVAVALLLYSLFSLAAVSLKLNTAEREFAAFEKEYEVAVSEQKMLTERLDEGLDDSDIEELARQRLGLVMPGERIFYFSDR